MIHVYISSSRRSFCFWVGWFGGGGNTPGVIILELSISDPSNQITLGTTLCLSGAVVNNDATVNVIITCGAAIPAPSNAAVQVVLQQESATSPVTVLVSNQVPILSLLISIAVNGVGLDLSSNAVGLSDLSPLNLDISNSTQSLGVLRAMSPLNGLLDASSTFKVKKNCLGGRCVYFILVYMYLLLFSFLFGFFPPIRILQSN